MSEDVDRALAVLLRNEADKPWAFGTPLLGLSRALGIDERVLAGVLAGAVDEGRIVCRSGYYATPAFAPRLSVEQRAFFDAAFASDPAQPMLPVARGKLAAAMRAAKIEGLELAFDTLCAGGALVSVGEDLYLATQLSAIRARLEAELRARKEVTVAEFRDALGTSRKYALPLLEWFDATGVTVRRGDKRLLRSSALRHGAGDGI
jgi:selenocysteine-specific elongation factor